MTVWVLVLLLVLAAAELVKPYNLGIARILEALVAVVAVVLIVLTFAT